MVREDWRIERVAVAAQTLAVSVLVGGASTRRGTRVARTTPKLAPVYAELYTQFTVKGLSHVKPYSGTQVAPSYYRRSSP